MNARIAAERLANQRLTQPAPHSTAELVAWLGGVQAQDYPAAKWALALRMSDGTTDTDIERAFDAGQILRTHLMRPTWHFVAASDIHWMRELTAARVHKGLASAYRSVGLDAGTRTRAAAIFERALGDGRPLTRAELGARLADGGVTAAGVRLALLTVHAEVEGVMCSGPQRGKQSTYALLSSRAPRTAPLSLDEALAELTSRYFRSHGPATVRDFVWWSGLTTADAKRGLDICRGRPVVVDGYTYWTVEHSSVAARSRPSVHLLPIYDEYIVAYRDLDAVPRGAASRGVLPQAVVVNGQIAGTWKPLQKSGGIAVEALTERRVTESERSRMTQAAARYGRFLARPAALIIRNAARKASTSARPGGLRRSSGRATR